MIKRILGLLMLCAGIFSIGLCLYDIIINGTPLRESIPFRVGIFSPCFIYFGWKWLRPNRFKKSGVHRITTLPRGVGFIGATMMDGFSKILLIDNDREFQTAFRKLCEHKGKNLSIADTAKQGMDLLTEEAFDAVVMSIELPDKNGLSVCNDFKKNPQLRDIPLVLVSGQASGETIDFHKQLNVRADAYFLKPDAHASIARALQAAD